MKPDKEVEAFFITDEIGTELIAARHEFAPPRRTPTASNCELYDWQPGDAVSEAVRKHLEKAGTASGRESRGGAV